MSKYFVFVLLSLVLFACGDSEDELPKPFLRITVNPDEEFAKTNSFTDLMIIVYENESDWVNQSNEIFSGSFDEEGKEDLSSIGLVNGQKVYADIFTADGVWSNWGDNIFEANGDSFITLHTTAVIGDWKLSSIRNQINDMPDQTPINLSISKDFKLMINYDDDDMQSFTITSVSDAGMNVESDDFIDFFLDTKGFIPYNTETKELYIPISSGDPGTEFVFERN
ncbi:MAG: hypothetical protein AAFQ94_14915 [Bacteroidota bacterium]